MRNMHVWPYFVSGDTVWFSDLRAGGLYTFECKSGEVNCKIKPETLFDYGIFEVASITCWKSFVFIFSEKLNGVHVVYHSLTNEIQKLTGLENGGHNVIHQANVIDKTLYLIPTDMIGYIYAINLSDWSEIGDVRRLAGIRVGGKKTMKTWLPKIYGHSLYIPEYGGKRVFCVTNSKIEVISLDIPSGLCTVGIFKEEIWAVPLYGKYIYCLTLEGTVKEKIENPYSCIDDEKSDIWEIIVQKEFVLFLHWTKPEIDIYYRKSKKSTKINGFELPSQGGTGNEQYYLPYIMKENVIYFLPSKCCMLEVDLLNFTYKKKEFGFPANILDEEWDNWCKTVRRYRYSQKILREKKNEGIKAFMEYVLEESSLQEVMKNKRRVTGRIIYQSI